jgi:glucose/mannose-6-phosphate isomerase
MKEIIYSLPDQILRALNSVPAARRPARRPGMVIGCGMGGSGISTEILAALYPAIPIVANKDYRVPAYADRRTLALFVSYSGNTEETLNNYRLLAPKVGVRVIVSSGGALSAKPAELKIKVPAGLPPRGALGYLYTPLPIVLHRYGLIRADPKPGLTEMAKFLMKTRNAISRKASALAGRFVGKLPVIYSDSALYSVAANRWRCQLNENAKTICHTNVIPEMNHNEIVGLGRPKKFNQDTLLVFLHDPATNPRNIRRVKVLKEVVRDDLRDIIDIYPRGKNNLQRLFWTIMLGDLISFYLAKKTGVDPLPVKRIEYLKKRLAQ